MVRVAFLFSPFATIFARDSRQQYLFMHKCNSTLNTLSSIANQTASLPLAMRFLCILKKLKSLVGVFHDLPLQIIACCQVSCIHHIHLHLSLPKNSLSKLYFFSLPHNFQWFSPTILHCCRDGHCGLSR